VDDAPVEEAPAEGDPVAEGDAEPPGQDVVADAPEGEGEAESPDAEASDADEGEGLAADADGTPDHGLSADEVDALGEVGNICMASAATSMSELLGHPVNITAPRVFGKTADILRTEHPSPTTFVNIGFTDGIEGSSALMISIRDASIVADLMMGGAGEPAEELNEMHSSAVAEAMNQMMGSASSAMAELVGRRVDISAPEVEVLDLDAADSPLEGELFEGVFVQVAFTMTVGDLLETQIMQIMQPRFARELVASLLQQAPAAEPKPEEASSAAPEPARAEEASAPAEEPAANAPLAHPVSFPALEGAAASAGAGDIALLMDVPLHVTVELGRTELRIRNVLDLVPGSIIELDRLAGEPVDVLVNGKNIARGEVVVIDEEFGVRITDVATPATRLTSLAEV
ncbi:MAG: flagellar motor switch phosphatase FliY, partial [Miltoncostaeaceae bacterium]